MSAFLNSTPAEKAGDHIGRYRLVREIGEGGCGIVYLAEQEEPVRREVALKVIKLGMDTKSVVARFEAERQALALMDHPNIAKVLDAGSTETGRPYFVMELVKGIKITEYCDRNNLSIRDRLELFIQVCRAIQHAHQKGIIHRDIKPSNILVAVNDGLPVPKVIDFGIAKATQGRLTDLTLFTAFEQFLGTPAYMSPEQAMMTCVDIDTRSDIYSLGVLLYELLTSQTPFVMKDLLTVGLDELRRMIREQEPLRPSRRVSAMVSSELTTVARQRRTEAAKLLRLLRGDLDCIVMTCLEKDRAPRYDTADGLAQDVRRYLNDEPVAARPPGHLYRFQKMVRRNKVAFTVASIVTASLLIGLGMSIVILAKERKANRRFTTAEQEKTRLMRETVAEEERTKAEIRNGQRAATLARVRANWLPNVRMGRLKAAAADLATTVELDPHDNELWFILAPLLVQSGDLDGYRKHRSAMLERFGATSDLGVAAKAAEACLLLTVTGADLERAGQLAEAALELGPGHPWTQLSKGLADYRQNRFGSAIEWERKAMAHRENSAFVEIVGRSVTAMALHQLKLATESSTNLSRANAIARNNKQELEFLQNVPEGSFREALVANILLGEANSLIEGK